MRDTKSLYAETTHKLNKNSYPNATDSYIKQSKRWVRPQEGRREGRGQPQAETGGLPKFNCGVFLIVGALWMGGAEADPELLSGGTHRCLVQNWRAGLNGIRTLVPKGGPLAT